MQGPGCDPWSGNEIPHAASKDPTSLVPQLRLAQPNEKVFLKGKELEFTPSPTSLSLSDLGGHSKKVTICKLAVYEPGRGPSPKDKSS